MLLKAGVTRKTANISGGFLMHYTFGTHLCPGLQKAVPVGTEGITCDFPVSSIL